MLWDLASTARYFGVVGVPLFKRLETAVRSWTGANGFSRYIYDRKFGLDLSDTLSDFPAIHRAL
jgi:hypothetical protein